MGTKMAEKWILAPPAKSWKNAQTMRNVARKWLENGLSGHSSHFPGHFSPILQVRPKSIFRPFRAHFGSEARNGSVRGPRD